MSQLRFPKDNSGDEAEYPAPRKVAPSENRHSTHQVSAGGRGGFVSFFPALLSDPAWWAALLVLLANDHYLKRAGLQPTWLTGKLSDFAGLVVAPVLVVALLGAKTRLQRGLAFVVVAVPFAILNVWSDSARLLEVVTTSLGFPWRIWTDPTDLIALAVLPGTAWLVARRMSSAPRSLPLSSVFVARLGAVVGAFGCLATSSAYETIETSLYLVNATHRTHTVHIYRLASPLDCAAAAENPKAALTAAQFEPESCKYQEPFGILPLDSDWRETTSGVENPRGGGGEPRSCDAVVLRTKGMVDTVVFWNGLPKAEVSSSAYRVNMNELDPRALYLEAVGDRLVVAPIAGVESWHVDWGLQQGGLSCGDAP